mmetsp:Transcript_9967/g.30407  ORF Transcript_9967/g.30407 Transcript_9967/m.30407 type:complete len:119 (+) Transcript_9967:1278-1634(+)
MTNAEWNKVGCSSAGKDRGTKICIAGMRNTLLPTNTPGIAAKNEIYFSRPWTCSKLFKASRCGALVRHELTHIRQQRKIGVRRFGRLYLGAFCGAGCSYRKNKCEIEARRYQNDSCVS